VAESMPMAIGRSNCDPSFFMSAGARFTVIFLFGNLNPEFLIAALTLSRLSLTELSGSPTIANEINQFQYVFQPSLQKLLSHKLRHLKLGKAFFKGIYF